jgi:tRNA (guanine-N7-)-methyltransferase
MGPITRTIPAFYGRRCTRSLTPNRAQRFEDILAQVDLTPFVKGEIDFPVPKDARCWMEIGFGDGDHLRQQMDANPQVHCLGAEVFLNGIEKLICGLAPAAYDRLHVFPDNVHKLMPLLPVQRFERIFILFPDPWPKRRHHKRRLVQQKFLRQCYDCLAPGGELYLASDVPAMVEWMLSNLQESGLFSYVDGALDPVKNWPAWPASWPMTKYGKRADQAAFLIWKKV